MTRGDRGQIIGAWLRTARGDTPQVKFLDDLARATGWRVYGSNYSKYENGVQVPTDEILARFVAYWRSRGVDGPDLVEHEPAPSLEERHLGAILAQTEAMKAQTDALRQIAEQVQNPAEVVGEIKKLADIQAAQTKAIGDLAAIQAEQTKAISALTQQIGSLMVVQEGRATDIGALVLGLARHLLPPEDFGAIWRELHAPPATSHQGGRADDPQGVEGHRQ